jgi:hypothetical protein
MKMMVVPCRRSLWCRMVEREPEEEEEETAAASGKLVG